MKASSHDDLPIFVKWMSYLSYLNVVIDRMPKKVRFTLSDRIFNLSLDIAEKLVEARYQKQKIDTLNRINVSIEKIRVLFRIAHDGKFIGTKDFFRINEILFEVGKMIGGWKKEVVTRNEAFRESI
jgi:23S rRNA-intervening sequence protein